VFRDTMGAIMLSQSLITRVCCEAVRSAILATAWLLVIQLTLHIPEYENLSTHIVQAHNCAINAWSAAVSS